VEPILAGRGVGHLRVKGKQGRCKRRLCVNEPAAPVATYLRRYPCGATWGCRLWGGGGSCHPEEYGGLSFETAAFPGGGDTPEMPGRFFVTRPSFDGARPGLSWIDLLADWCGQPCPGGSPRGPAS